jgi:hypothetical protein
LLALVEIDTAADAISLKPGSAFATVRDTILVDIDRGLVVVVTAHGLLPPFVMDGAARKVVNGGDGR